MKKKTMKIIVFHRLTALIGIINLILMQCKKIQADKVIVTEVDFAIVSS